jgi:hypothetical protein
MIEVQVEFPEGLPGQKLSLIGCRRLDADDATIFDGVLAFAEWARSEFAGTENREYLVGQGPITLHLVEV